MTWKMVENLIEALSRLVSPNSCPYCVLNVLLEDHVYDVSVPDGNDDTEASKGASHALRKKAAAGLDAICSSSGSESLLPIVLPLLQARLMCEDVHSRETGILALGAIAECQQAMNEHLLHIFPFVFPRFF